MAPAGLATRERAPGILATQRQAPAGAKERRPATDMKHSEHSGDDTVDSRIAILRGLNTGSRSHRNTVPFRK